MAKFASGKYAKQDCDICGFTYKYGKLKEIVEKNTRTGILACKTCWNPSHPQLRQGEKVVVDPQALRQPRPDTGLEQSRQIFVNDEDLALAEEMGVLQQLGDYNG